MRKGFFARLAVVNIRKNKQIYVPYAPILYRLGINGYYLFHRMAQYSILLEI